MPDKITTECMESEEEESITYAQVIRRTVTMGPEQWAAVDALAREKRHRGKASPALREIVDYYIQARQARFAERPQTVAERKEAERKEKDDDR